MAYIDREAYKAKYLCFGYLPEMSEEEFDAFPEADVAPVVHGRWICKGVDECFCSECKTEAVTGWDAFPVKTRRCPECGAIMNLED